MAGHSQFKNIMRRKEAQDAKKAKVFTKIMREINAACRQGLPDPLHNPRLRAAMLKARSENISKDRIEDAIKRASGAAGGDDFVEIRYEGYGPGGVAVIVEALSDNRNRTASDIRSIFTKHGGNLGESGSVNFMFERVGQILYPCEKANEEAILEVAIDVGADNCESDAQDHSITCAPESFGAVRDALEKRLGEPRSAGLIWRPLSSASVNEDQARALMKMLDALEDNDDVQDVFSNEAIAEEIAQRLSA